MQKVETCLLHVKAENSTGGRQKDRSQHPGQICPLSDGQGVCVCVCVCVCACQVTRKKKKHYLFSGCPCSCPLAETFRVLLNPAAHTEPLQDDSAEIMVLEGSLQHHQAAGLHPRGAGRRYLLPSLTRSKQVYLAWPPSVHKSD